MSPIKMFCLDLDGTLLTDQKTITEENKKALQMAADRGIKIVIATGRQYRSAREFARQLEIPLTVVSNNGTCIRDPETDQRIHFNPMPEELCWDVIRIAQEHGHSPIIHVDRYEQGIDIVVSQQLPASIREPYGLNRSQWVRTVSFLRLEDLDQAVAVVFFGNTEELELLHKELQKDIRHHYVSHFMQNLMKFEAMLEILGETGTKWHGIELCAERFGIRPEEVAVIGDDGNDLQMVQQAALSFAPSNAIESVKKAANYVLPQSNNEHAICHALERIFAL